MNDVQIIFEIMHEERGYTIKEYVDAGFTRNTVKNWQRGITSPKIREFQLFLQCMGYDMTEMFNRAAEHENR